MARRKQMWADADFVTTLEHIKARKILNGQKPKSIPELTREILEAQSFKDLVSEIINDQKAIKINVRFDKRRI